MSDKFSEPFKHSFSFNFLNCYAYILLCLHGKQTKLLDSQVRSQRMEKKVSAHWGRPLITTYGSYQQYGQYLVILAEKQQAREEGFSSSQQFSVSLFIQTPLHPGGFAQSYTWLLAFICLLQHLSTEYKWFGLCFLNTFKISKQTNQQTNPQTNQLTNQTP